jgi:organic hydroperoxide reductase OsmC/OhrA
VELLAAAIATAVSATIAIKMGSLGARPAAIETHVVIKLQEAADRWKIVAVHLEIGGQVSNADIDVFRNAVEEAQADCPIASELNLPVSCSTKVVPLGSEMVA